MVQQAVEGGAAAEDHHPVAPFPDPVELAVNRGAAADNEGRNILDCAVDLVFQKTVAAGPQVGQAVAHHGAFVFDKALGPEQQRLELGQFGDRVIQHLAGIGLKDVGSVQQAVMGPANDMTSLLAASSASLVRMKCTWPLRPSIASRIGAQSIRDRLTAAVNILLNDHQLQQMEFLHQCRQGDAQTDAEHEQISATGFRQRGQFQPLMRTQHILHHAVGNSRGLGIQAAETGVKPVGVFQIAVQLKSGLFNRIWMIQGAVPDQEIEIAAL